MESSSGGLSRDPLLDTFSQDSCDYRLFVYIIGDSVTIASTEELLDACEQYVGQKVLRITTYVKPYARLPSSGQ